MSDSNHSTLPLSLIKAISEKECVLVIGSGASTGEGLISASELADKLSAEINEGRDQSSTHALREAAALYEATFGRPNLENLIVKEIRESQQKIKDPVFYKHLNTTLLPTITHIITTNWDSLIEDFIPDPDKRIIRSGEDLANLSNAKTNIIKLHGCIENSNEILVTQKDYNNFRTKKGSLLELIKGLYLSNSFVFIGHGLEDENINALLAELEEKPKRKHYYVSPSKKAETASMLEGSNYEHVELTATEFITELHLQFQEYNYDHKDVVVEIPEKPDPDALEFYNPFESRETEALSESPNFLEFFERPVDISRFVNNENIVIEGHRGSGKTMTFMHHSLLQEHKRKSELDFWGYYVKLEYGFFDVLAPQENESELEWKSRAIHYFNLVLGGGILNNITIALEKNILKIDNCSERDLVTKIRSRLLLLESDGFGDTLSELQEQIGIQTDILRANQSLSTHKTPGSFARRLIGEFSKAISKLGDKRVLIFLDEWDNLGEHFQRVVIDRLHDRDSKLRYKIGVKTLGFTASDPKHITESPHDFGFIYLDRHIHTPETKKRYIKFLEDVANTRLNLVNQPQIRIRDLLPAEPKSGKPRYSGFENFAVLSSGFVKDFLDLCKDAVYLSHPDIALSYVELEPIPIKWQLHSVSKHSAIHYANITEFADKEFIEKLLHVITTVYKRIDNVTSNREGEHRHPLSFDIPDKLRLTPDSNNIILSTIRARLIQLPPLPIQGRNPSEGVKQKYTLHRLLCPRAQLPLTERYCLPLKTSVIEEIWRDTDIAIKFLLKGYEINPGPIAPPDGSPEQSPLL